MVIINTYNILYLISNLFRIYVIYRFINIFFDRTNIDKRKEICILAVYYIFNSYAYLSFHNPIINLFSNLLSFFLLTFIYGGKLSTRLVSTALIYAVNMVLDSIVFNILDRIGFFKNILAINSIISNILLYLFVLVLERFIYSKDKYQMKTSHWIAVFFIPFGSIIIVVTIFLAALDLKFTILIVSYLLGINVLSIYLYDIVVKYYAKKYENELLLQQNIAYKNEFEIIKVAQDNIRMLWHDMKNHNYKIQDMVQKGQKVEVLNYLHNMLEFVEVKAEYDCSGNTEVDSILNYKMQELKKLGTTINANINIPNLIKIDAFDLNIILGNLMDNSIEALKNCKDKNLSLNIEYERGILYIAIKNSYTGKLLQKDGNFFTTKKQIQNHGFGLKSIQNVIKKYNGAMEIDYDEKIFTVVILLYNPD